MKQAVKATALVLFVSLLSGCSSSGGGGQANNCEAVENTRSSYDFEAGAMRVKFEATNDINLHYGAINIYKKSLQVILNNPDCFTPGQVVEAQDFISKH